MFYVFENTNPLQMEGLNDAAIIHNVIYYNYKPKVVHYSSRKYFFLFSVLYNAE